jgi:poly(3-hydroxybutyrate) depolymerase
MSSLFRRLCLGIVILLPVVLLDTLRAETDTLPALGVKLDETSVSGLSSGAYMAGQFHVAHSSIVKGAGLVAGGPYGCAASFDMKFNLQSPPGGNVIMAWNGCMEAGFQTMGLPDPDRLTQHAKQLAAQGRIDALTGLAADSVYIYTGKDDHTVLEPIVAAAADFYKNAGVAAANIKFLSGGPGGHAFLTDRQGATCQLSAAAKCACGPTQPPYINNCQVDQAGDILGHIYGPLAPKSASAGGEFVAFDQNEFTASLGGAGMSDTGVVYVPPTCKPGAGCRVHVAFHGCEQYREAMGDDFIKETGFARWADTNQLVVLFPQVRPFSVPFNPLAGNPKGCWDWWGYLGADFMTKQAPQILAVRRMLDRLAAPHSSR